MKPLLKHLFLPHSENNHTPHLFRAAGVAAVLAVLVLLGSGTFIGRLALRGSDFLAAVLPAVLADLANADRAPSVLPVLTVNPVLTRAAQLKADDMAKNGYFSHVSPSGVTPWYWLTQAGYRFSAAGENLAVHFDDSSAVNDAWMASPSHRANIMNGTFTEIGIATSRGVLEGRETVFVVQMFGKPLPPPVAPVAAVPASEKTPAAAVVPPPEKIPAVETAGKQTVSPVPQEKPAPAAPAIVSSPTPPPAPGAATLGASTPKGQDVSIRSASPLNRLVTSPSRLFSAFARMLALLITLPLLLLVWHHLPHRRVAHIGVGFLMLLSVLGAAWLLRAGAVSSVVTTSTAAVFFAGTDSDGR